MKNYYITMTLNIAVRVVIYLVLISIFVVWWSTPWVYAVAILAIPPAVKETQQTAANMEEIDRTLKAIRKIHDFACVDADFHSRRSYEYTLTTMRKRYSVFLGETEKLLTQVTILAKQADDYKKHVKETLRTQRAETAERKRREEHSRRDFSMEFFPLSERAERAVTAILNLQDLKSLKFKNASAEWRRNIVLGYSKTFAIELQEDANTIYNLVMGRLASASLKKAA